MENPNQPSPKRRKLDESSKEVVQCEDYSSDALIEQLLAKAEKNLASNDSTQVLQPPRVSLDPGHLPKPYFELTRKGSKLLTDQLEDSLAITSHDGKVNPLFPPLSKRQKEKVSPSVSFPNISMMLPFLHWTEQISRPTVLVAFLC